MPRNFDEGCKLSEASCPRCGTSGNFVRHACYDRTLVTEKGEAVLRIIRVRCLTCGSTHSLIPPNVIPYKVHSLSLHTAVACAWVDGEPLESIQSEYRLPATTFLRMLRVIRAALSAALATMREREPLREALSKTPIEEVAARSLRVRRACLFENVRLAHRQSGPMRRAARSSGFT